MDRTPRQEADAWEAALSEIRTATKTRVNHQVVDQVAEKYGYTGDYIRKVMNWKK